MGQWNIPIWTSECSKRATDTRVRLTRLKKVVSGNDLDVGEYFEKSRRLVSRSRFQSPIETTSRVFKARLSRSRFRSRIRARWRVILKSHVYIRRVSCLRCGSRWSEESQRDHAFDTHFGRFHKISFEKRSMVVSRQPRAHASRLTRHSFLIRYGGHTLESGLKTAATSPSARRPPTGARCAFRSQLITLPFSVRFALCREFQRVAHKSRGS